MHSKAATARAIPPRSEDARTRGAVCGLLPRECRLALLYRKVSSLGPALYLPLGWGALASGRLCLMIVTLMVIGVETIVAATAAVRGAGGAGGAGGAVAAPLRLSAFVAMVCDHRRFEEGQGTRTRAQKGVLSMTLTM